jgi:FtsP/CotA-like multicopper oxidase with cupredoxin domain
MRLIRHREPRALKLARKNRREIIAAGLKRRDLLKMGLVTSAGYLAHKHGLSQWASGVAWGAEAVTSPPTRAFVEPLALLTVKRPVPRLSPAPTVQPNTRGGEGRTRAHQAFEKYPRKFPFPPRALYEVTQRAAEVSVSPDLPPQTIWGFDGLHPGPLFHARYGEDILVRQWNQLPAAGQNDGFGIPEVITHLHNLHTPSESDGFPCDHYRRGQFYDHHYPNVLAGFASTHPPDGDINEALGTLWYHDHRIEFTAQNVYKGLHGMYLLFNELDTGDETKGFRLPGVRESDDFHAPIKYDVPLVLADRVFDPDTGQLFYDLFNLDGILGDRFLVNGKIQPTFEVEPRRYRFRILNVGPSRFQQIFLTDGAQQTELPFWQVANDGNLLPRPVLVKSLHLAVAERMDVVVDFRPFAGKTLYLENRQEQIDGRGPTIETLPPGKGNLLLQLRVSATPVEDRSAEPSLMKFYDLPARPPDPPAITRRRFGFQRRYGMWTINSRLMTGDCNEVRLRVRQDSAEQWQLWNPNSTWMHPIHIHFEEFQIWDRDQVLPEPHEAGRKDVLRLRHNEKAQIAMRFRDFDGRYLLHCHNLVHEDDAMMLRWDVDDEGDTTLDP